MTTPILIYEIHPCIKYFTIITGIWVFFLAVYLVLLKSRAVEKRLYGWNETSIRKEYCTVAFFFSFFFWVGCCLLFVPFLSFLSLYDRVTRILLRHYVFPFAYQIAKSRIPLRKEHYSRREGNGKAKKSNVNAEVSLLPFSCIWKWQLYVVLGTR